MIRKNYFAGFLLSAVIIFTLSLVVFAQPPEETAKKGKVRTVTIPISIFTKRELKGGNPEEVVPAGDIMVKEDGDDQVVLSIRQTAETPLAIAFLIQDNLATTFNLELKGIADFIRRLPKGTRVYVGYLRSGTIQTRQRFTDDLEKAANSLRIVTGSNAGTPGDLYDEVREALDRFDALPTGRRSIFLVSDGVDLQAGSGIGAQNQSVSLERAILKAQRKSVAVYPIYYPSSSTGDTASPLVLGAQGSLERLADETGGRAFFQGTSAPVSMEPFLRNIRFALNRQFVLTYLSTHMKKGYHKIQVTSTNPDIKIEHPKGYYYRP